jgi:hypothetical protein
LEIDRRPVANAFPSGHFVEGIMMVRTVDDASFANFVCVPKRRWEETFELVVPGDLQELRFYGREWGDYHAVKAPSRRHSTPQFRNRRLFNILKS